MLPDSQMLCNCVMNVVCADSMLWSSEPPRVLRMLEALPEFTALQRLSLQDFWCVLTLRAIAPSLNQCTVCKH